MTTQTTDPTTAAFIKCTGRRPIEGDFYAEPPEKVLDDDSNIVEIRECHEYQNGRWESFVSVHRGGTWAR